MSNSVTGTLWQQAMPILLQNGIAGKRNGCQTGQMTESFDVSWQLDGITMSGTVTRPDGVGEFPAVVLVAGSGPTDRDWCSPLLPGDNGSARLLAEALAGAGIASMRYDKRASGPHVRENLDQLFGRISMQSHLDELVAAVEVLVGLDFVDRARIIGLGNSEGTLHILHYATSAQAQPFAGIVLAAPPGRPIQDVLMTQLERQAAQLPNGSEMMSKVREAARRYAQGRPMDPDPALPESVRQVLASFEAPANLPLARELWVESAVDSLPEVRIPVLVMIGGKDIQIEMQADGEPLQAAAVGMPKTSFAFPPLANHVFKEELRSLEEISAAPGTGYNEPGTRLDPESVQTILAWIAETPG
jgi:pimeloyl-ACP methyl ester carboxylesterase